MNNTSTTERLVFSSTLRVTGFGMLKNRKRIFTNKRTGASFLGTEQKHKNYQNELLAKLIKARPADFVCNSASMLRIQFKFAYPRHKIVTKKNALNRKCGDLSNLYQMPEDCLQRAEIISDDVYIVSHAGSKRVISPDENYYIEIKVFEIEEYKLETLEI